MPSKPSDEVLRVALDTNNLISAHINDKGPSAKILDMIYLGKIEFYSSPFQMKEFARVLPRVVAEDPDDDEILAIAMEGRVDFIVSGDRHLLDLGHYKTIPILNAQDFLDRGAQG